MARGCGPSAGDKAVGARSRLPSKITLRLEADGHGRARFAGGPEFDHQLPKLRRNTSLADEPLLLTRVE